MNDFSLCHNMECKRRAECRRGLCNDDPYQSQAYYPGGPKCFGYVPLCTDKRGRQWRE